METENKLICEGSFGKVYEVTHQGNKYALKKYKFIQQLQKEWAIHQKLQHKNIVTFIVGNKDFIMMEMMKCDLFTTVMNEKYLNVNVANFIMKEIVNGVKYMHDNGFVHRDLKLENILIGEGFEIKICDFGYTEKIDAGFVHRNVGTREYMAPELYDSGKINCLNLKKADLFALGVIYFEMLFGHRPFKELNNKDKMWNLIKDNEWRYFWNYYKTKKGLQIPQQCKDIIQGLLKYNPAQRIGINQLLQLIGDVDKDKYIAQMIKMLQL